MSAGYIPVQTWGRLVSPNEDEVSAQLFGDMPATISITMAALDPGEEWSDNAGVDDFKGKKPRATIKMIVYPVEDSDDDEDDEDDETDPDLAALLDEDDSDEDDNGEGPSDLNKSRKALLAQALLGHGDDADSDDEGLQGKPQVNGVSKKAKGKAKASAGADLPSEEDEEDDEDVDSDDMDMDINDIPDEYVLCTLDPDSHYQQPLNITISASENVFFRVEGTHSVHLTGNYLAEVDGGEPYDSDDYDLSPDEDELADLPSDLEDGDMEDDDESDELDDIADPRIMELDEDDEEPALVAPKGKKNANNKRAAVDAESEDDGADVDMADAKVTVNGTGDKPLSKSQQKKMRKKLKDNAGNAVDLAVEAAAAEAAKPSPGKGDKKVQFAKTLVQGPTGSDTAATAKATPAAAAAADKKKPSLGPKVVDGVTIDDKKLGSGPAAKKGDKISMRYIGKLDADKRVFDSNKKGAPFGFKLGGGQVIRGWDIGVAGMQAGGERRIVVPAHLAYGSRRTGDIPPNSTLVFDLKLLEIKK